MNPYAYAAAAWSLAAGLLGFLGPVWGVALGAAAFFHDVRRRGRA